MTTASIPASIATACAAHDRHRLDVLDALLDEAAPSAVRELLGAALDLCATLRTERDALAAQLAEVRAELADTAHELEQFTAESESIVQIVGAGPDDNLPVAVRSIVAHLAACRTRIAGLEQAANERSAEVARLTADYMTVVDAIMPRSDGPAHAAATARSHRRHIDELEAEVARLTARVAELEARPVLDASRLAWALLEVPRDGRTLADIAADILAKLGPVTLAPPAARQVFAGVSLGDLEGAFFAAERACKADAAAIHLGCCRLAGIGAVLARLEVSLVAPVDPEKIAADITRPLGDGVRTGEWKRIKEVARAALTAAGIPVTPEVGR